IISPYGTVVDLETSGASGTSYYQTVFDDEASTPISSGTAPYFGSFQPEDSLSAFDGEEMQGTWTLWVYCTYHVPGTLEEWSVFVEYDEGGQFPLAPSGLTAIPSDQQITLTWNANSEPDLAKYRIYRDTSSPAETLIDSVVGSPPDNSYTDTGLTNGQEYFYFITAVDSSGNESGYSAEVSATPQPPFTDIAAGLDGAYEGQSGWVDYDSDGDLDLLTAGYDGTDYITRLYRNDDGDFNNANAGLPGYSEEKFAWGDYD
ncbi:unnamed protein product, partial [marine sediment metagenome]